MTETWRFTGPPENWLAAFGIGKWALNENKRALWENEIHDGDVVFFHSKSNQVSVIKPHPPSSEWVTLAQE